MQPLDTFTRGDNVTRQAPHLNGEPTEGTSVVDVNHVNLTEVDDEFGRNTNM